MLPWRASKDLLGWEVPSGLEVEILLGSFNFGVSRFCSLSALRDMDIRDEGKNALIHHLQLQ